MMPSLVTYSLRRLIEYLSLSLVHADIFRLELSELRLNAQYEQGEVELSC